MAAEQHTSSEMEEEIRKMVSGREFQDERKEFSPLADTLAARTGKTGDEAWSHLTGKIVEFLPGCITGGLISCSLSAVGDQEICRQAVQARQKQLVIRPNDRFPAVAFGTFSPYLEFLLRAGPVDILRMKSRFRVEGKMALRDARILLSGEQVEDISGTLVPSVKIFFCTGTHDVLVHQFERPIQVK